MVTAKMAFDIQLQLDQQVNLSLCNLPIGRTRYSVVFTKVIINLVIVMISKNILVCQRAYRRHARCALFKKMHK